MRAPSCGRFYFRLAGVPLILPPLRQRRNEIHNLAGDPEHAETLERLRAALEAWLDDTDDLGDDLAGLFDHDRVAHSDIEAVDLVEVMQ